jgi:hypothetical protein
MTHRSKLLEHRSQHARRSALVVLILIYPDRRLVPVIRKAACYHGGDSVLSGGHPACPRAPARLLHRYINDRLHRGAGIVVRNSIILVDFIELRLKEGVPLD